MLNTIQNADEEISLVKSEKRITDYNIMPASWIAQDMYAMLLNINYNDVFLAKFDKIPQNKINETLKNYFKTSGEGLLTDMYVKLGISIRDLKPRILSIINSD